MAHRLPFSSWVLSSFWVPINKHVKQDGSSIREALEYSITKCRADLQSSSWVRFSSWERPSSWAWTSP